MTDRIARGGAARGPTYSPRDLLRLSGVLSPLHVVLVLAFSLLVWPLLVWPLLGMPWRA